MSAGGAGAVVRSGHLRKLKTMKKKFFVLRAETSDCSARLEYYESEKKFRSGAVPRRVLPLKSCYNITRRLDLKQKHVIALFTREEQFCVVAENEQDLHGWLTAMLKHHRNEDGSEELRHPIQHVWQVNVQKKGLGATKNIQGLYNLCLTDQTLTLVKIKSQNNVISDLGIPERVAYTLKHIRRCGDSECFFYMEVGRLTGTGAGELWMHTDDANIAQSMHSTIYHAMRNCAKAQENELTHIVLPKTDGSLPARRQTYSDGRGRSGLGNERGLCVGACLKPCVCTDDSAVPLAPHNDAVPLRSRCDSMPSRASHSLDQDVRPVVKNNSIDGIECRDELDGEWHRTPRIPEEPDFCDRDLFSSLLSSVHRSRTSSSGPDELDGYLPMCPLEPPAGGPPHDIHSPHSGSVCSGTPSTDPRFSEYQLEPATSHIVDSERPPRAYSVGSRPTPRTDPPRHRAYSVGARHRAPTKHQPAALSAPLLPRSSADDLMELDFSNNSPAAKVVIARSPPAPGFMHPHPHPHPHPHSHPQKQPDEYVDMSPRNAGYVEMKPGDISAAASSTPTNAAANVSSAATSRTTRVDGYVEMNYGKGPTRPIDIARPVDIPNTVQRQPLVLSSSPEERRKRIRDRTPLGSQTLFPFSPESPISPPELDTTDLELEQDMPHHALSTISEDGRKSPEISSSPSYVTLAFKPLAATAKPIAATAKPLAATVKPIAATVKPIAATVKPITAITKPIAATVKPIAKAAETEEIACNPTATKIIAREPSEFRVDTTATVVLASVGAPTRFSVSDDKPPTSPGPLPGPLNYVDLDLEPARASAAPASSTYTQIDFARSEKLAADGN